MINIVLVILAMLSIVIASKAFRSSNSPMLKIPLAIYFINFILGHLILTSYRLVFKPNSNILLGDFRLSENDTDIQFLITLNLLQFIFVCLGSIFVHVKSRNIPDIRLKFFDKDLTTALICITLIGWIGNIGAISGNINLLSAFHPFELLGTAWLISGFRLSEDRKLIVVLLASLHLIWAIFYFHSKSEAFVVLIALIVRLIHTNTKVKTKQLLTITLIGVLLFPFIQVQKGIMTLSKIQSLFISQGQNLPYIKSFALSFLQRFDGADSITDAYCAGAGSWHSPFEYSQIIIFKFIPNISFIIGDYFGENTSTSRSLGQLWNDQVRPLSIVNVTRGVPVSYGPMAEGYALSGLTFGLFLCLIFGILMNISCSACYSANLFATTCGLYYISHLENLQNSLGNVILMAPKMLECYILLKVFQMFFSKRTQIF